CITKERGLYCTVHSYIISLFGVVGKLCGVAFIIPFDSGVIVIRHWHIHNTLRKDRAKMTVFKDERQQIIIDESGVYCLDNNHLTTKCQPNGNHLTTKCPHNIREDNIRENNIRDISEPSGSEPAPTPSKPALVRHKYGEYKNVLLSDEELEKLKNELPGSYKDYIERLSEYMASKGTSYKSHFATLRSWARKDKKKQSNNSSYDLDEFEEFAKDFDLSKATPYKKQSGGSV
ncbi:MAG: hypothetical protein IJ555_05935, partial [Ruminococcus sp.]|nr:hypothetical protein [Ruminococcus sp.]